MNDNITPAPNGAEVYMHDIYYYADQYICKELEIEKVTDANRQIVANSFVSMILYISDNIERPGNDNIELLDNIFDIYIRLCSKYGVLPTLECFSFLVKINNATFSDWAGGKYRANSAHSQTVKKWKEICKSFLVNNLQNSKGTDANKIFIAKAAYGMVETAPVPTVNPEQPQMEREEIAARYRAQLEFKDMPDKVIDVDNL